MPSLKTIQEATVSAGSFQCEVVSAYLSPSWITELLTKTSGLDWQIYLSATESLEGATQLHQYMSNHELHESVQSGFRTHHRTETTLIKIANDIMTVDFGHISILKFPHLSAAFGTCSHTIQLSHISRYLVLTGTVISCFQSHLSNPTQCVTAEGSPSPSSLVNHVVSQGSVLGPLHFTIYMLSLGQIMCCHGLCLCSYDDDTHNVISAPNPPPSSPCNCLSNVCIASEHGCHLTYLSINSNKTDLLVLAPKALLWKTGVPLIDRRLLSLSPEVHNQGVVLDSAL